jgi:hypothetical protein
MYPSFSPLLVGTAYKSSRPCNFLRENFYLLTDNFLLQILRFLIPLLKLIESMWKKYFWGHISTCCKLLSQTRTKQLKKTKNVFYKCVLEFNFSSIHGSVQLIFSKKSQNRCSLMAIRIRFQRSWIRITL